MSDQKYGAFRKAEVHPDVVREIMQDGIATFLNVTMERSRKHSGEANLEDMAAAVGYFGVHIDEFYESDDPFSSFEASDYFLAELHRQTDLKQIHLASREYPMAFVTNEDRNNHDLR